MEINEAREILKGEITADGKGLFERERRYLAWFNGTDEVFINGRFTVKEIEAIAVFAKEA